MTEDKAKAIVERLASRILKEAGLRKVPAQADVVRGFCGGDRMRIQDLCFMDKFEFFSKSGRYSEEAEALNVWMKCHHSQQLNLAQPVGSRVNIDRIVCELSSILKDGLKHALAVCEIEGQCGTHVQSGRHRCVLFAIVFGFDMEVPVVKRREPDIGAAKKTAHELDEARRKEFVEGKASNVFCRISENGSSSGEGWQKRLQDELLDGTAHGHSRNKEGRKMAMITARLSQWEASGLAEVADEIGMPTPRLNFPLQADGSKGLTLQEVATVVSNGSSLRVVKAEHHWECAMRMIANMERWIVAYKGFVDVFADMAKLCLDNLSMVDEEKRMTVKQNAESFLAKPHLVFQHNILNEASKVAVMVMYGKVGERTRYPEVVKDTDIDAVARMCAKASIEYVISDGAAGVQKGVVLKCLYYRKVLSRNKEYGPVFTDKEIQIFEGAMTDAEKRTVESYGKRPPVVSWEEPAVNIMRAKKKAAKAAKAAKVLRVVTVEDRKEAVA